MIKKTWNFFTSLKLTIYLGLLFIAVTIIGSFYIQNYSEFFSEIDMNILFPWLFKATNLDYSMVWWIWLILFLLVLLAVNTFVCSIDKIFLISKFIKNPSIEITQDFVNSLPNKTIILESKDLSGTKQNILKLFNAKNYRTIVKEIDSDNSIIHIDKGGWSKYAPYVVHLAFLLVLTGHFISSFSGMKISGIPLFEGKITPIANTNFLVRFNNVNFEYFDNTQKVKNYKANISIFEGEKEFVYNELKTNNPIFFKNNFVFYMITFGYYQDRYPYMIMSINQDKGVNTVFIGTLLMLLGLYCCLFVTYRRFWIIIFSDKIQVCGWADNVNFELEKNILKITKQLEGIK